MTNAFIFTPCISVVKQMQLGRFEHHCTGGEVGNSITRTSLGSWETNEPDMIQGQQNYVPALVHKQYNSPMQLYSSDNVADALISQAEVLTNGAVGVDFRSMSTPVLKRSEVYRVLQEEEKRGSRIESSSSPEPTSVSDMQQTYQSQSFIRIQKSLGDSEGSMSPSSPRATTPQQTRKQATAAAPTSQQTPTTQQRSVNWAAQPPQASQQQPKYQPQQYQQPPKQPEEEYQQPHQYQQQPQHHNPQPQVVTPQKPQSEYQPQQYQPHHYQPQQYQPQQYQPPQPEPQQYQPPQEYKQQPQQAPQRPQSDQSKENQPSKREGQQTERQYSYPSATTGYQAPPAQQNGSANMASPPMGRRRPVWPPVQNYQPLMTSTQSIHWSTSNASKKFVWPPPKEYTSYDYEDYQQSAPALTRSEAQNRADGFLPQPTQGTPRSTPRSPARLAAQAWEPYLGKHEEEMWNPAQVNRRRLRGFDEVIHQSNSTALPPTYRAPPGTQHVTVEYY